MKCPICSKMAVIRKAENVTENGKDYRVLHYYCINRKCSNYEKEVREVKNPK